jgi:hypothetical protein
LLALLLVFRERINLNIQTQLYVVLALITRQLSLQLALLLLYLAAQINLSLDGDSKIPFSFLPPGAGLSKRYPPKLATAVYTKWLRKVDPVNYLCRMPQ